MAYVEPEHYKEIPEHCREGLRAYIEEGRPVGGFLTAVLENDLMEAFGRADMMNRECLYDYCQFLYNHAPADCHGSPEKVKAWLKRFEKNEGSDETRV